MKSINIKKTVISVFLSVCLLCCFSLNCLAISSPQKSAAWIGIESLFNKNIDIQNICNYINGDMYYANDKSINDIEMCSTYASMLISSSINSYTKSDNIPEYLSKAHEKICTHSYEGSTYNLASSSTTDSYTTSGGHFIILYDQITLPKNSTFISNVHAIGNIFESIYSYFVGTYGMSAPTTDGTIYEISLVNNSDLLGQTPYIGNSGHSKIIINYDLYVDEIGFFRGCAAHEFMHAIQISHGIPYYSPQEQWFQESLARSAGITYELYYANHSAICGYHQDFLNSLSSSLGTVNNDAYQYGGSLFFLCLNDEYDSWEIINDILAEYEVSGNLMTAISEALYYAGSSIQSAYRRFMVYNTNPDDAYSMSPKNRMTSGYSSWGTPTYQHSFSVVNGNSSSPTTTTMPFLSGHFYKFYCNSSIGARVIINIDYYIVTNGAVPDIMYGYHDKTTGEFHYVPATVTNNNFYLSMYMSSTGIDELFIVVMNSGLSGYATYDIDITTSAS